MVRNLDMKTAIHLAVIADPIQDTIYAIFYWTNHRHIHEP